MVFEIMGVNLEEPLPLIGVSIWNIILFIIVLIIGILVVRFVSKSLKKWMIKANLGEILAEFSTRVIRLILYIFIIHMKEMMIKFTLVV